MPQPTVPTSPQAVPPSTVTREPTRTSAGTKESIQSPHQGHQKLVFTDPIAFRYLEEDPSTFVLHRRTVIQGYEIYVVEQWACSRVHPTFIITTYTGEPSHKVVVGVLSVPTDESTWSPRLKLYFNAVTQCHGRQRETPLGTLIITDLNSFPSALTVIPVPDGDVVRHRQDFVVNENLKRLNCAGRAGLKLQPPTTATEAKFHQLYRTSDRVPLYSAVIELVKQCQIALMMFGDLAPAYVDGLLCDVTEAAINDWWTDMGIDLYNIEPSDGVLGPTTVAALLGTLMGARNRLHAFGAPVGKDAFDISNLKRGISSFQKSQKIPRTRRLDRHTLDRLHRVTAKAANQEGWTDTVKSTMAELGGHGGEMVMGMVRGREKGGIADIETLDVDNFAQLVTGQRAKWLWRGKPRKNGLDSTFAIDSPADDMALTTGDQGGYLWTSFKRRSDEDFAPDRLAPGSEYPSKPPELSHALDEKDQNLGRMMRRGVSGKVSDARIGFGRFKDAVGFRSHPQKPPRDGTEVVGDTVYDLPVESDTEGSHLKAVADGNYTEPESMPGQEAPVNGAGDTVAEPALNVLLPKSSDAGPPAIKVETVTTPDEPPEPANRPDNEPEDLERWKTVSTDVSVDNREQNESAIMSLRRPQSCNEVRREVEQERPNDHWPRHLSFSTVEEVVLGWEDLGNRSLDEKPNAPLEEAIMHEETLTSDVRIFYSRLQELGGTTVPWVEKQVDSVDELNRILHEDHEKINATYMDRLERYQHLRDRSCDTLTEEHSGITDRMRQVELIGAKLDYEVHALESKVEDVETGLAEFERHVNDIETRIKTLVRGDEEKQNISWLAWLSRLAGLSTP